jgi:hypothetical protein
VSRSYPTAFSVSRFVELRFTLASCTLSIFALLRQPRCTRTLRQPILSQWQEEARLQELYARAPSTVVPKLRPWMEVCGSRARRRGKWPVGTEVRWWLACGEGGLRRPRRRREERRPPLAGIEPTICSTTGSGFIFLDAWY